MDLLILFAFFCWHEFCAESKRLSGNLSQKRENNEPIPFPFQHCCGIFSKKMKLTKFTFLLFHCFTMVFCCLINHHSMLLFHEFEAAGKKRKLILLQKVFSLAFLRLKMLYNTSFNFLSICRIWTMQRGASVTYNIPFQPIDFSKLLKPNFSSTTLVTIFSDLVIVSTSFWIVLIVNFWCHFIIFSEIEPESPKSKILLEDNGHNIGCFCSSFNIFSKHLIRRFCRNEIQDSSKRTFARRPLLQDLLHLFSLNIFSNQLHHH